jgi:hypothetical protein
MKARILKIVKTIAIGLAIFVGIVLGTFSWLKWFASDDIKVAVGNKFPLLMMIDNHPVNEEAYLENKKNDSAIYKKEHQSYVYPLIRFAEDSKHVKKLCLIDFTGDDVYETFELQQLQQGNASYYILIMYGKDGRADIYHTKGLKIKAENYTALMNKVTLIETNFNKVKFDVTGKGIDAYVSIKDKQGRTIGFEVKENKEQIDRYGIIAPIGSRSNKPEYLPIIYLKNFNFIPQKGTKISVKIDGKSMKPQKLIPFFNYKRVYMARYSDPVNTKLLNPNYSGSIEPIKVSNYINEVKYKDNIYSIKENNGHLEINQIRSIDGNSEMKIKFSPAVPDLISLKDNTEIKGHFSFGINKVKGIMAGVYSIKKNNGSISFKMNPQEGWQPMPGSIWMKTYLWNCDIKIKGQKLLVNSKWSINKERIK